MDVSLKLRTDGFLNNFQTLNKKFRWTTDNFLKLAALNYARSSKHLDELKYEELLEHIRKSTGYFSTLRTDIRFPVASVLANRFEDSFRAFDRLKNYVDLLKHDKVGNDIYTVISAMLMTVSGVAEADSERIISRAKYIYNGFKKYHYWVTSHEDYPYAFMLAIDKRGEETLLTCVEWAYEKLAGQGLKKGNDLQKLSHVLAVSGMDTGILAGRCRRLYDSIKERKLPSAARNYLEIGLLAPLDVDAGDCTERLAELKSYIDSHKDFKWYSGNEMNFMLAVALYISEYITNNYMDASLAAALAAVQAAQDAAIAACTATIIAAATASSD